MHMHINYMYIMHAYKNIQWGSEGKGTCNLHLSLVLRSLLKFALSQFQWFFTLVIPRRVSLFGL